MATQATKSKSGLNQSKDVSEAPDYLSAFQRLGERVYFYHPVLDHTAKNNAATTTSEQLPQPDIIIICSWMAASSRHIAKYTNHYLSHYKHIPLLLVRCSQHDAIFKPTRGQIEEMRPAITAVQSVFGSVQRAPRVLMHNFSNGGCWSAHLLNTAYQKATGGLPFPISALVLDSCPSIPHLRLSHRSLSATLPKFFLVRIIGSILIFIMIAVVRALNHLHLNENLVSKVRRVLNDPADSFIKSGVPRVYICSKTDAMVPYEDVRSHAREARTVMRQAGIEDDQLQRRIGFEEFNGSPHVGHLMVDADRYWSIIDQVWSDAMDLKRIEDVERERWKAERMNGKR